MKPHVDEMTNGQNDHWQKWQGVKTYNLWNISNENAELTKWQVD
jgi:hypothetical protein